MLQSRLKAGFSNSSITAIISSFVANFFPSNCKQFFTLRKGKSSKESDLSMTDPEESQILSDDGLIS
jgi:hypothetical protein